MLILSRPHLEIVLAEYFEHYNFHRPHRSVDQRAPAGSDATPSYHQRNRRRHGTKKRPSGGGLIHENRMVA
jgi:transposase InsO family protein